ncbi:F0F1 ATP synthase subunit A, partial [Neisseria sp. P0004.S001]
WASTGSVDSLDRFLFVFLLIAGLAWSFFLILVFTLQAFIFMSLALV